MTKQVRETAAGQSISATVVLNKKGEHVATVQAHYSNAGRVTVDVWSTSVGLEGMCKRADLWAKLPTDKDYKSGAFDLWSLQQGSAGGYGYDKHAAALAGLIIDGHTIADHCGQVPEAEKARAALLRAYRRAVVGNAVKTPAARDGPGSGVSEMRMVSPMPSCSSTAKAALDATMPLLPMPASVRPRCRAKSLRVARSR